MCLIKNMIKLLEKYSALSWIITILIAGVIFYLSSLSFGPGKGAGILSYFYHFLAFFWLGFFLLISLVKGKNKKLKLFYLGVVIAILYAVSDEIHQLFVPSRFCSLTDVLTDSSGILSSSLIYLISLRKKSK